MLKVFNKARATVAHYWPIFRCGGPVALSQAISQARIQRRIVRTYDCIEREERLHAQTLAQLRATLNHWLGQQQSVAVAQAQFSRFVTRTNNRGEVRS